VANITHGTWIKDGKAIDAVYQGGVKVYGRNLLRDTATQSSNDWYIKNSGWTSDIGTYLDSRAFKTAFAWDNVRYAFSSVAPLINTTDAYTYSIYVKVVGVDPSTLSDSYTIYWFSTATSAGGAGIKVNTLSGNDWQRVNQTFTFNTNVADLSNRNPYNQSLRFEIGNSLPDGAFIYFAAPKLEKGTIATSYSQAPEDVGVK
jgi:hypothetical protein